MGSHSQRVGWMDGKGKGDRGVTHESLEGGDLCKRMSAGIVRKLSHGEEGGPIVLADRGEGMEILFQFLVRVFSLAISLGVICCG